MSTPTTDQLIHSGTTLLRLMADYSESTHGAITETKADLALYAYLEAKFGHVSRQMHIYIGNATNHPKRVDFRIGGTNPVLIEFAFRSSTNKGSLSAASNKSELRKLGRFPQTKAKRRVLLLIDAGRHPQKKEKLKAAYNNVTVGRGGKNVKHPVSVIYVHEEAQFSFPWKP